MDSRYCTSTQTVSHGVFASSPSPPPSPSTYGSSFQKPRLPRAYTADAAGMAADDVSSNITGYRRSLDVPGLPSGRYFSHGASKVDRRSQYIDPSLRGTGVDTDVRISRQLTKCSRNREASPSSDLEDDATVSPADSISQVSSNRSRPLSHSTGSRRSYQPDRSGRRDSAVSIESRVSSSYSHADKLSTYEGPPVYDEDGGFYKLERRPRWSGK